MLPELTAEERAACGAGNFTALALAFIVHAREHGPGIAEAGRAAGEFFAHSWPPEVTPAYFVSGMNGNWQMWGARTEVLELSDRHATRRRDRLPTREHLELADLFILDADPLEASETPAGSRW